jgi:hypothetical protein
MGTKGNIMKWEKDLVRDIRTGRAFDDQDAPYRMVSSPGEVTECNRAALTERFLRVRDKATAILEIGICRNHEDSHTFCFLNNKKPETIYVGIDIDDKTFLNNKEQNIHTIKGTSSNVLENMEVCKSLGVEKFDFIFIDGLHSINQVLIDWEYSNWLADDGIIGFHDVTAHPGPAMFIEALNKDLWNVEENVCVGDYGIGFAWKK